MIDILAELYHTPMSRKLAMYSCYSCCCTSGVTMGWLLRLVTGAPLVRAPDNSRVLNDQLMFAFVVNE